MKKYGFMAVIFFFSAMSITQTNDSFSDGDFITSPTWFGSASQFIVNASQQLQLNATGAGTSYLVTDYASGLNDNEWQFYLRLTFAPSSSNYARIYIASDKSDLTQPLNGYFVQFGEAGSNDAIELFRQQGSVVTSVCRGTNGAISSSFSIRLKIKREGEGVWTVLCDRTGDYNFEQEATGLDNSIVTSSYTGILCSYTSSNSTKFFLDDYIAGGGAVDPLPPIQEVLPKDIVISEIFADPSPSIALPTSEFIELFNRSDHPIDLFGWKFSDGTTTATFGPKIMLPKQYLIVTSSAAPTAYAAFGETAALASFPSLNNDADNLTLFDTKNLLVDHVSYALDWYADDEKQNGGWTLELIDPGNICAEKSNWIASEEESGGTPGRQNSVFASKPDLTGPELLAATAITKDTVMLIFNEKLDAIAPSASSFVITPSISVDNCNFADLQLDKLKLALDEPLQFGQLYTIQVADVFDCSGNTIQPAFDEQQLALPQPADSLDVFINEILFNPKPLGVDFVEIFNASTKYIDMKGWKLANFGEGVITHATTLTSVLLLPPGAFIAFTSDPHALKNNFPFTDETKFYTTNLPSLPDDDGSFALVDSSGTILDEFNYSSSYHSGMLKDEEGVSLERISVAVPTNESQNWKSASSRSGYGTPGAFNSVSRPANVVSDESVVVSPEVIVPDSGPSGYTEIQYAFDKPDHSGTIKILDALGRVIKNIANNELLGAKGFYRWDGDRDDGTRARSGYYIALMEVTDVDGMVKVFRRRVIVAIG